MTGSSLRTISQTQLSATTLAAAGGIAAGLILLVVLPSRLLDSTLRSNYVHVFGWLDALIAANLRRIPAATSRGLRWGVTGGMLLVSAVLLGFTDPGFGLNEASVRLTIALAITIAALGLVRGWATGTLAHRWWSVGWGYAVRPGGILLLVAGVLITRLLHLEPGILLGVWLGATLAYDLGVAREGKLVLATTAMVTVLGLTAWIGYSVVTPIATAAPSFGILLVQEILSTLTLKSLATFIVLLLPLTFLDGLTVWKWSRGLWLVSYFLLAVVFALIVLPLPSQWSDLRTPMEKFLTVFGIFTLISFVVWAWFRKRPSRSGESQQAPRT